MKKISTPQTWLASLLQQLTKASGPIQSTLAEVLSPKVTGAGPPRFEGSLQALALQSCMAIIKQGNQAQAKIDGGGKRTQAMHEALWKRAEMLSLFNEGTHQTADCVPEVLRRWQKNAQAEQAEELRIAKGLAYTKVDIKTLMPDQIREAQLCLMLNLLRNVDPLWSPESRELAAKQQLDQQASQGFDAFMGGVYFELISYMLSTSPGPWKGSQDHQVSTELSSHIDKGSFAEQIQAALMDYLTTLKGDPPSKIVQFPAGHLRPKL